MGISLPKVSIRTNISAPKLSMPSLRMVSAPRLSNMTIRGKATKGTYNFKNKQK